MAASEALEAELFGRDEGIWPQGTQDEPGSARDGRAAHFLTRSWQDLDEFG